jgi:uridine kinase
MQDKDDDFDLGVKEVIGMISKTAKPVLVLIAGGSFSGKTFLATRIKKELALHGRESSLISLDDFFRDIDDPDLPRNKQGRKLFDVPESYHQLEFLMVVKSLLSGKKVFVPIYDKMTSKRKLEEHKIVAAEPVVLVEGLFVVTILKDLSAQSIKVYVDTEIDICLQRRIEHDTVKFGVSAREVEEMFLEKVLPNHLEFVLPQREMVSIIIKSSERRKS